MAKSGGILSSGHRRAFDVKEANPHISARTLITHLKSKSPKTRDLALINVMTRAPEEMVLCAAILAGNFPRPIKEKLIKKIAGAFSAPIWFNGMTNFFSSQDKALQVLQKVFKKMTGATPPFFIMLAKLDAETVREIHGLWTEIKPRELPKKISPKDDSFDSVTFNPDRETAARHSMVDRLSAVYNRFEFQAARYESTSLRETGYNVIYEHWTHRIHLLAYEIDGLLFVL